jgi:Rap1a immunity proteins
MAGSIMKRATCFILALVAMLTTAAKASEESYQHEQAGFVCDQCASNSPDGLRYCFGWMDGVNSYQTALEESKNMKQLYCFPDGLRAEDARQIFVKYCEEHPEVRSYRAASVFIVALVHAYPCKK